MRKKEKYEKLAKLKTQINEKIGILDFEKTKELILWLAKSPDYQKLKVEDSQLEYLDFATSVWLEEKRQAGDIIHKTDIFCNICSLDDLENRYTKAYFAILRLENSDDKEFCLEAVNMLTESDMSAIAILKLINRECFLPDIVLKISKYLKFQNQYLAALELLTEAEKNDNKNDLIQLELADCWIFAGQFRIAYDCLKRIVNPSDEIEGIMSELEKVMDDGQ